MEYVLVRFEFNSLIWKYYNGDVIVSSGEIDKSSYSGGEIKLSDNLYFDKSKGFYKKVGDNEIYLVIRVNVLSYLFGLFLNEGAMHG